MPKEMDRELLAKEIEFAFHDVGLGDGIGIYEASAIDDYAVATEIEKARTNDRASFSTWQQIPNHIIEHEYSSLTYSDLTGTRFLLPAYMTFTINNYEKSDSFTIDSTIYAINSNRTLLTDKSIFSQTQKRAISHFLKYMAYGEGKEFVDAEVAAMSYEGGWNKYDTQA